MRSHRHPIPTLAIHFLTVVCLTIGGALLTTLDVGQPPAGQPTATPSVTATPSHTPSPAAALPELVAPMVLNIDTTVSAGWRVERAARVWNRALDCQVFTFAPNGDPDQMIYHVTETVGLMMAGGTKVWALHTPGVAPTIQLDPTYGVQEFIAVHEYGHALGLHHGDGAVSVMNVENADRDLPSADDVAQALANQIRRGRCAA